MPALLLILESFGTSEMLVILVVALIFFGPRKLPELSRKIGKSLAEFRKASEDFKHTWEREVALETTPAEPDPNQSILPPDNSVVDTTVPRSQAYNAFPEGPSANPETTSEPASTQNPTEPAQFEPAPKRDWL